MKKTATIQHILSFLHNTPQSSITEIADSLDVSKQYISRLVGELINAGCVEKIGNTKGSYVILADSNGLGIEESPDAIFQQTYLLEGLAEDVVMRELAHHAVYDDISSENKHRFEYVFTEMLNNAIDHSSGEQVHVTVLRDDNEKISCWIADDGIGVFANVKQHHALGSELDALQDIVKGKTTTDPEHHSGEGIFFSSKVADRFILRSHELRLVFFSGEAFSPDTHESPVTGTIAKFTIFFASDINMVNVFNTYTNEFEFDTSSITIKLYTINNTFISRSEAKRLLNGLEQFRHIILDFADVKTIGQGFADEIFRVWHKKNAHMTVSVENTKPSIAFMIKRAQHNDVVR